MGPREILRKIRSLQKRPGYCSTAGGHGARRNIWLRASRLPGDRPAGKQPHALPLAAIIQEGPQAGPAVFVPVPVKGQLKQRSLAGFCEAAELQDHRGVLIPGRCRQDRRYPVPQFHSFCIAIPPLIACEGIQPVICRPDQLLRRMREEAAGPQGCINGTYWLCR